MNFFLILAFTFLQNHFCSFLSPSDTKLSYVTWEVKFFLQFFFHSYDVCVKNVLWKKGNIVETTDGFEGLWRQWLFAFAENSSVTTWQGHSSPPSSECTLRLYYFILGFFQFKWGEIPSKATHTFEKPFELLRFITYQWPLACSRILAHCPAGRSIQSRWHLLCSCNKQGINICKEEIMLMHRIEIFHTLLLCFKNTSLVTYSTKKLTNLRAADCLGTLPLLLKSH